VAILLDSVQIARYQNRERESGTDLPGRYAMGFQGKPVFALYDDDVPTVEMRTDCLDGDRQATLCFNRQSSHSALTLQGANCTDIRQLLTALDGKTRLGDACVRLSRLGSPEELTRLCQALLGYAVFLPEAIRDLEQGIRRVEIVRFPMQSPYLVLREYWSNCRNVRAAIPALFSHLSSHSAFKTALADLHILATMGSDLCTYYFGSGGVPTIPGGYRTHPVCTGLAAGKAKFIDSYLEDIGLRKFRRDEYYVVSDTGILLGAVAGDGLIFRHPPAKHRYLERILEEMRLVLADLAQHMERGSGQDIPLPLSRFHKLFLHAHPFYNINNSVAMNIVNYCLKEGGYGAIPHLLLDFIALRIEFEEYAHVFRKAVEDYAFTAIDGRDEGPVLERISRYLEQLRSAD
jgi:hypothetical protein